MLSNRAGEGGAGSSVSVDILRRTVPLTSVLHMEHNITAYARELDKKIKKRENIKFTPKYGNNIDERLIDT